MEVRGRTLRDIKTLDEDVNGFLYFYERGMEVGIWLEEQDLCEKARNAPPHSCLVASVILSSTRYLGSHLGVGSNKEDTASLKAETVTGF